MDTTRSVATVDPMRYGSADSLGDSLVHLEGARGCFSGSPIDYRMPCTASEDAVCQIVASVPLWNAFLCWLDLELRSIRNLGVGVFDDDGVGGERLGQAVARTKTIRKIRLLLSPFRTSISFVSLSFLDGLCANISQIYALCCVCLDWKMPCLPRGSDSLAIIQNTVDRNLGYVARAAQFLNQVRRDM
ncbi:hypothetical protein MRX96_019675 [Rhipicephalus microplus]